MDSSQVPIGVGEGSILQGYDEPSTQPVPAGRPVARQEDRDPEAGAIRGGPVQGSQEITQEQQGGSAGSEGHQEGQSQEAEAG